MYTSTSSEHIFWWTDHLPKCSMKNAVINDNNYSIVFTKLFSPEQSCIQVYAQFFPCLVQTDTVASEFLFSFPPVVHFNMPLVHFTI